MSYFWKPYVPVAERRAKAKKKMDKLKKKGTNIQPVELFGKKIAHSFWGKSWCEHLESFSDYENRLPRGRTYVRNGSVCHLDIQTGRIDAFVSGSELYKVTVQIKSLATKTWEAIKHRCQGQIGSVLELLQGKLSDHVMEVVSDRMNGLFPQPGEMTLACSCPDWATMCKHVAAVLYGVGSRLDCRPELLFVLRGVDAEELISAEVAIPTGAAAHTADALAQEGLAEIFGVDIETSGEPSPSTTATATTPQKSKTRTRKTLSKDMPAIATQVAAKPVDKKLKKTHRTAPKARKPSKPAFDPKAPTGKAIAELRKLTQLSVSDFARLAGVTAPSILRWERTQGPLRLQLRPLEALSRIQEELLATHENPAPTER